MKIVRLPAGEAVRASWNVPFVKGNVRQRIETVEYGFARDGHAYFFQFTTGLPIYESLTPLFENTARSIVFSHAG